MQAKDLLTIAISALALLLSGVATVMSLLRGRYERQRAVRAQITDLLGRLTSADLEWAKLSRELGPQDAAYWEYTSGIFAQQKASLLQQTMYLAEHDADLVTAVDYNTIAVANAAANDFIRAEEYYRKAVDTASGDLWKLLATRSYAVFLFMQGRFEDGRQEFQKAVNFVKGNEDLGRFVRGKSYQTWASCERGMAAAPQEAQILFQGARAQFDGIDNKTAQQLALSELEAAERQQDPPFPGPFSPLAVPAPAGPGAVSGPPATH
jgi:tetratricopeptide (TPR) repeat protein